MEQYKLHFHNVHPDKTTVSFTWDDNFLRHIEHIAPAFAERGMRCTFYINPGEEGFEQTHLPGYLHLSKQAFEIGSHGYLHQNLCNLPYDASVDIVQSAIKHIQKLFHVYPTTFAFPYHDYNEEILSMTRSHHLETRNTLARSKRFGIKTDILLGDMLCAVDESIDKRHTLVFSGHSVILSPGEANDAQLKDQTGYNPILLDHLSRLLDYIQTKNESIEVLTFEQAALKEYVLRHCEITGNSFIITQEQLNWLKPYHIGIERLGQ